MSNQNYISDLLELSDNDVIFKEKITRISKILLKDIFLINLNFVLNVEFYLMINLKTMILLPLILKLLEYQNLNILLLHKQQYLCKHYNKAFTVSTLIVNYGCHISNNTKEKIVVDLTKKSSEKDIAENITLSSNTEKKL